MSFGGYTSVSHCLLKCWKDCNINTAPSHAFLLSSSSVAGVSWDEMHTPETASPWTTVGGYYTILLFTKLYFHPWYFLLQVPGLVQGWSSKLKPNQLHTQVVTLENVFESENQEKCLMLERFQKIVGKLFTAEMMPG